MLASFASGMIHCRKEAPEPAKGTLLNRKIYHPAGRSKKRKHDAKHPLTDSLSPEKPEIRMQRFLEYLEKDLHAKRLRDVFLRLPVSGPELEQTRACIWKAATVAMLYVHDSKYFLRERVTRLKRDVAELRREYRRLSAEIVAFQPPKVGNFGIPITAQGYVALREHEMRKRQLAEKDQEIRRYLRAMNTKHYGKNDDLSHVLLIRELLERPQGARIARLTGNDLMAILDAAAHTLKKPVPHKDDEMLRRLNIANLMRQLNRFERDTETAPFRALANQYVSSRP